MDDPGTSVNDFSTNYTDNDECRARMKRKHSERWGSRKQHRSLSANEANRLRWEKRRAISSERATQGAIMTAGGDATIQH